jgi:hypothetical protein
MGRHSLYKPEYCQQVVDDMKNGFTIAAFAGSIGTNRQTLINWQEANPDFKDAVARGKAAQLRWWEERAHRIVEGQGGPGASAMACFGLSNLGDGEWRNKQDLTLGNPDGSKMEKMVIVLPSNGRE